MMMFQSCRIAQSVGCRFVNPRSTSKNSYLLLQKSLSHSTSSSKGRPETTPKQIQLDHAYCVNLVRERDREGYLSGLLMPSNAQKAYFALRAFNVELASIKDGSNLRRRADSLPTATTIALQMRMQWWRDALEAIYNDGDNEPNQTSTDKSSHSSEETSNISSIISISCWHSPVVRALDRAHAQTNFTRRFLERLIDAREADLGVTQYATIEDLIAYSEETWSSLLYLSLECTGIRDDEADTVASHAGVGIGLTTSLRATPYRLVHGEVPLPAELFPAAFPFDSILRSQESEEGALPSTTDAAVWEAAVRQVANEALLQLSQAQSLQSRVPKAGRACFLPVVPAYHYLAQLQQVNYNLFDQKLLAVDPKSRLSLLIWLGRTWLTGVF